MKQDRIAKAYEGLNNKELATLAFHYLTNTNQVEMARVGDAVPKKLYKCKDAEFVRWYECFFDMAGLWSIEHWRAYALMLEARVEMEGKEKLGRMESRLLAVDAAMLAVCEEHGIDPEGLQRMAGDCVFTATSKDMMPDADHQAEMYVNFGQLLLLEA